MTLKCARCKRPIGAPVVVEGRGYGPACARLVGPADLLTPKPARTARQPRTRRRDERQGPLFDGSRA